MKKYYLIGFLFLLSLPFIVEGQQNTSGISFDKTVHDFGEIEEKDGTVSYKFEFSNTGNEPIIVQRVTSSCGCTTPSWTKQPIMPGQKGYVSAAYNPKNRPGHFDKYITVQNNASSAPIRLRIKGKVNPKPLTIEEEYRFEMGGVRMKTNHLSFGTVYKNRNVTKTSGFINNTDEVKHVEFKNIPPHLDLSVSKIDLQPKEEATLTITYLSNKQHDWDFIIDRIDVYVDGTTDRSQKLIVSASLQEDFSDMSMEEKAEAAKVEFENKTFNFGKLRQGEKADHEFKFTNNGKSNLVIRKVRASCGCTAIMTSEKIIEPGEEGVIKVTFNSAGKLGNQNKTISVITNDPDHSREILWIRGEVIKSS